MENSQPSPNSFTEIPVFFCKEMQANSGGFSPSASKPAKALASWQSLPISMQVLKPEPVTQVDFERAHEADFVKGILSCELPNGFRNYDVAVAQSLPWTNGAMLSAAKEAITNRQVAVAPVSGFHHAGYRRNGGFCTFNGLMVTAQALLSEGLIRRMGILDFDQHWGDGTQDIIDKLDLSGAVVHYSPTDEFSEASKAQAFLNAIPSIVRKFATCDVVLYQAGADPHIEDPLGGWLTTLELAQRDYLVFASAKALGIPVAWNLAGGYQTPIDLVLDIHDNTMRACHAVYVDSANKTSRLPRSWSRWGEPDWSTSDL